VPVVESSVVINAPFQKVWETAMAVDEFPKFMDDVRDLKVVERSDDGLRTVTDWTAEVKEFKMAVRWKEEDVWDTSERTCRFRMLSGDYAKYEGVWTFKDLGDKVEFNSMLDYEYNVPLIGPLIKNLIAAKMRQNAENLLQAIKAQSEKG